MPEPIQPHATPIAQTGAPEWAPPLEDDNEAALKHRRPQNFRAIFFGRDGLRAGWALLLFAALNGALSYIVNAANRAIRHRTGPNPHLPNLIPVGMQIQSHAWGLLVLLLSAWVVSRVERRHFGRYGIGILSPRRIRQCVTGAALGLGMLSLLILGLRLSGLIVFDGFQMHGAEAVKYALLWAIAFLGVGFVEEFVTRGFVQFTLTRGIAGLARTAGISYRSSVVLGFWLTAALFSIVFGLGHTSNPGESPIGIFAAGLIGLAFTFSLWRTGSLWWAIGFHAAWDWAESYLYGTADSGLLVEHHLLASHPVGKTLLSGGLTGPEGSAYVLGIILLTALIIAFTLPIEPGSYADPNWTPNDPETPQD